jgi:hypothetical protein
LIVLTAGELTWNRSTGAFDAERTTALPARLMSAFAEEPLYLDLRWARSEDQLSSRHPRFRDAVADLAAALHGREKDELVATPSEIEEKLLGPRYLVAITRGFNRLRIWETSGGRERPSIDAPLALDLDLTFDPTLARRRSCPQALRKPPGGRLRIMA